MKLTARPYQIDAARFMWGAPYSALLADPGTGKTSIVLMLLTELKRTGHLQEPVLIVGPLRIIMSVWPDEISKWNQFAGLSYCILRGKEKFTLATGDADIHLINNENLVAFLKRDVSKRYRILIIDESSKYKTWGSARTKAVRYRLRQFTRRHLLTGSPAPKSLVDLFAQMFLIDAGEALGKCITHFRRDYCRQTQKDVWVKGCLKTFWDWEIRPDRVRAAYQAIAPKCFRLARSEVLQLPGRTINDIFFDLPEEVKKQGLDFLTAHDLNLPINQSAEVMLARRLTCGLSPEGGVVHQQKIKLLTDLIDELQGQHAIILFYFRAEGEYLAKRLSAPLIYGGTGAREASKTLAAWNARELPLLLLHPAAGGHGLNLQFGGRHMIWFSYTYNQDDYYQANMRVWRPGVAGHVWIHRLIARDSVDVAMVRGLEAKGNQQQAFLSAIGELTKCH